MFQRQMAILIFVLINVLLGLYHGSLQRKQERDTAAGKQYKKIKHGWWAWAYAGALVGISWISGDKYGIGFDWWMALAGVVIRKPTFDISMNTYRFGWSRAVSYVSQEVKNCTSIWDAVRKGKTIDYLHWKIYGSNNLLYCILYLLITIYIVFFQLNHLS